MAAGDVTITVIGNLTNDPELRFTPSGAAVARFTVASTPSTPFRLRSIRAAQDAHDMPSSSSRSSVRSGVSVADIRADYP